MAMFDEQALSELINLLHLENEEDMDKILNSQLTVESLACTRLSVLGLACHICNTKLVQDLLEHGADVNTREENGMSPLHILCSSEKHQHVRILIAQLLLQYNVDTDLQDASGRTALLLACSNNQVGLVNLLIQAGCDVNIHDKNGDSPFTVTCRMASAGWYFWNTDSLNEREEYEMQITGNLQEFPPAIICKALLHAGADTKHSTLLPSAVLFGTMDVVKEFLDLGMDVNLMDENGRSPLGCACSSPHMSASMVKLLLEKGADVNKDSGSKPIILAYVYNSLDKMCLLLSYGASVSCDEMSDLVSVNVAKWFLENPLVISEESQELLPWKLLLKAGFRPKFSQLLVKLKRVSLCSSYDQIRPWIHSLFSPVLSLSDICRVTIRSQLQSFIDNKVDELPLPNTLKGFLKFNEFLDQTLQTCNDENESMDDIND